MLVEEAVRPRPGSTEEFGFSPPRYDAVIRRDRPPMPSASLMTLALEVAISHRTPVGQRCGHRSRVSTNWHPELWMGYEPDADGRLS